jgi:hypothetical protein
VDEAVKLKIYVNCVRRARWNARLGFTQNRGPIPVKLNSILPLGGVVGTLTAILARVYPMLYMSKDSNGKTG